MGRFLPWLRQNTATRTPSTKRADSDRPAKLQKLDDGTAAAVQNKAHPSHVVSESNANCSNANSERRSDHVLSQNRPKTASADKCLSMPPRVYEPVEEEPMHEGLQADDIYKMVEDEFYDVALKFTAHIHQDGYDRMLREARERNVQNSNIIARPVDGRTVLPKDVKNAKERREMAIKRERKLGSALDESSEGSDSNVNRNKRNHKHERKGTTLGGLLLSPSKAQRSLIGLQGPSINSRSAAGFTGLCITPTKKRSEKDMPIEQEGSESSSEDDLDATPTKASRPKSGDLRQSNGRHSSANKHHDIDTIKSTVLSTSRGGDMGSGSVSLDAKPTERSAVRKNQPAYDSDEDGIDDFFQPKPLIKRTARGIQQPADKSEDGKKTSKYNFNDIPTFLG